MDKEQFYSLYHAFLEDRMEPRELQQFRDYCQQQPYEQWLEELLENTIALEFAATEAPEIDLSSMRSHLLKNVVGITPKKTAVKYYYAAAASLVVLLAATFYLWLKPAGKQQVAEQSIHPAMDIQPARDIATLTLSDGSTILLDSARLLKLSAERSITAAPGEDGGLSYRGNTANAGMNELSTPRGGQFKLILPDGTRVWLNAASSIIFPTVFSGNTRPVKITGEVYLEVKEDHLHPFMVETGNATVEVLGTSFNIDAYADEGKILTTLLDGSISIKAGKTVIMKPGQQVVVSSLPSGKMAGPQLINGVDLQKVMAWKNGFFNFDNVQLTGLMKQLERWYDIDVKYDGPVPGVTFKGGMDRDMKLSGIIRFLTSFGIHAKLEGRTLHISSK